MEWKTHFWGRTLLLLFGLLSMGVPVTDARADHTACLQFDGDDGPNTLYGTNGCDEFWMRGGTDNAWAYDNPLNSPDYLYMGGGTDAAHGGAGRDMIKGGDNPTSTREELRGGAESDEIEDLTGPDWDLVCGGDGQERIVVKDNDYLDKAYGEGNPYGHEDGVIGDSSAEEVLDGSC